MKLILIILILLLTLHGFGQENTPKRGSLKIRKKVNVKSNIQESIINIQDPTLNPIEQTRPTNTFNTPISSKVCNKYGWLNGVWDLIGFPDRTIEREAVFDEIHLTNCTEFTVSYSDLPTQKMRFTINEENNKIVFKSNTKTFNFDYTLKVSVGKKWDPAQNKLVIDTIFKRLKLYNTDKKINFYLVTGNYTDEHNYFPHVCKEADEEVNNWISEKTDSNGYKIRVKFNSCKQINVRYENTLLKNRKESIIFKYQERKNFITLKRQKIGVPNEYFDSQYQIEFKKIKNEHKLVLKNEKEALLFSIEK